MNKKNIIETKVSVKETTYCVFWIEDGQPQSKLFRTPTSTTALAFCQDLRRRAHAGAELFHICISSDMIDNVSLPGVNDKLPDGYEWKMRRRDYEPGRDPFQTAPWQN